MPVNWTTGKRHAAKTKYRSGKGKAKAKAKPTTTKTVNKSRAAPKKLDKSTAENLFHFSFAANSQRGSLRSRDVQGEEILERPSRRLGFDPDLRSAHVPVTRTTAEKRRELLQMKSWSWLSPSRQHSTDDGEQNLAGPDHLPAPGQESSYVSRSPTARKTDLSSKYRRLALPKFRKARDQIGTERVQLSPSPSLSLVSTSRGVSSSSTMKEHNDRQEANSYPSTRISGSREKENVDSSYRIDVTPQLGSASASSIRKKHKDQLFSIDRNIISVPKKTAKRKSDMSTEVTPQVVLSDPPAEVDPPRPNEAHRLNESNSTKPDHRAPLTLPRKLHILPALMERFRKKHIGAPADDPTEVRTARSSSHKTYRSTPFLTSPELGPEESFSDGFSDVFATASSHPDPSSPKTIHRFEYKRPNEQLHKPVRFSPSKSPEVHYSSSSSVYSFRNHSPSHLSIQEGLNDEEVEEETCILEHSSDTKILDNHSLKRSSIGSESDENMIKFSESDIDEQDFTKNPETNVQASKPKLIRPLYPAKPTGSESKELLLPPTSSHGKTDDGLESDVPEWVKLLSSRMGFSPPKTTKFFIRKS